jgi:hypothetical protein
MKVVEKIDRRAIGFILCISILFVSSVFADNTEVLSKKSAELPKVREFSSENVRIDRDPLSVPLRLNYQGYLTDDNSNPVSDTATMVFSIYTAASGGNELWNSGSQVLTVDEGIFHYILADVPMSVFESGQTRWLELSVRGQILIPRTEITSVAWSYYSTLSDSAGGAIRVGGQDLSALDARYINSGENAGSDLSGTYPNPTVIRLQTRPVSSAAPATGQVLKWNDTQWVPANDTAGGADNDWIISGDNIYSGVSGNVGIGTSSPLVKLDVRGAICGGWVNNVNATYGAVLGGYSNTAGDAATDTAAVVCGGRFNVATDRYTTASGGRDNVVSGTYATVAGGYSSTASGIYAAVGGGYDNRASGNYSTVAGGRYNGSTGISSAVSGGYNNGAAASYATVCGGNIDSALAVYSGVLSGYSNLAGIVASDTGAAICGGYNNICGKYSYVGGGSNNSAGSSSAGYATVAGGSYNGATAEYSTVGGGTGNAAGFTSATVAGGYYNSAGGDYATVGGGNNNNATATYATISGGESNLCYAPYATSGGGRENYVNGIYATVAGGYDNRATGGASTIGGGHWNCASSEYATVGGGLYDTSAAYYSFTVGLYSKVVSGHNNSAAFNGQVSTASGQTRVGALSKASGTFTIDHPLDPTNKILNHYFVESPEMVLIYRGVAVIGNNGRAEVNLPDYYDALNENSQIQLTGVGTYEVFIAEEVQNNRFMIGGKPGTEVHWMVTGERKDPSAKITKIIMPVEQTKDGDLAGRSLDDDFLCSTREQLERMGQAAEFGFRLATSQHRYEEMRRIIAENR